MGKFLVLVAVAAGVYYFAGDKIMNAVIPGRGAISAYEHYVDALMSQEWEEARFWSAGSAAMMVEDARYVYMMSSENIEHQIKSKRVNGDRVEFRATQLTRYFPDLTTTRPVVRTFEHEVAAEKRDGEWKVVHMFSEQLMADGERVPADRLGRLKQATGF